MLLLGGLMLGCMRLIRRLILILIKIAFGFDWYGFRRFVRLDLRRLAGAIFPLTSAEVFTILRQTKRNRQGRRGVRSQTPSERAVRRLRDSFGTREWKVASEPER